ncbi:MAG: AI-2E family transporter [Duncaniella sp.]|nr:AI-2E family transporter [Duncaniella sp.]
MPSVTYWTSDRIMRLIIGLVLTAGIIWLLGYLSEVLLPFFVGCFIAYMLQPLVELNRRWIRLDGRIVAVIVTLLEVTVVIGGVIYLFLPSVVGEVNMMADIVKDFSSGRKPMPESYRRMFDLLSRYFEPDNFEELFSLQHMDTLIRRGSSLVAESVDIVLHTLEWLLTLVYILFILIDYHQITRGFKLIIPGRYRSQVMSVVRDVESSMNRYFRGQGVVALCAAVFYCAGFSIVGIPLAIPLGLLVGVLYMIPYFQYVTLVPVAAVCFIFSLGGTVEFLPEFGKCCLVYVVSQSVCDYVITPHVMGREMGLNPAVILLSLSVWGYMLGVIGMIIALPFTSLIMTYYERYISRP